MPVLRITFTSQEAQQMAALCADDIVILRSPSRNPMGLRLAPPPPPAFLSGSGVSGGGGFSSGSFCNVVSGHAGGVVSGSSGISVRGVGGMVGGGIGWPFLAPTQQILPQKRYPVEAFAKHLTRMVNAAAYSYNLPLAESAYMDYPRHEGAGLHRKDH